jgi:bacterioferritin-associated ferredoxin
MIVEDRELPDSELDALIAIEDAPAAGVAEREILGYHCGQCGAADETRMQVVHREYCPLAGEHGREHYAEGELPTVDRPPELERDHRIDIITAGWTDPAEDVHNGEAIGFRCGECGNADDSLFEIIHDEACSLAGRYASAGQEEAVTDGGR